MGYLPLSHQLDLGIGGRREICVESKFMGLLRTIMTPAQRGRGLLDFYS